LTARSNEVRLVGAHQDDPTFEEVALIDDAPDAVTQDRDRTTLRLAAMLRHCYDRETVTVNANVAPATHGESVAEIVGSGDAASANQRMVLKQSPLTSVSAPTATGRAATLQLRVNDLLWQEVPSLYERSRTEHVYQTSIDDAGRTTLIFGDGVEGARLPSGQDNLRASYRKGLGTAGNLDAGRLTNLLTRPLGVTGVNNPEPASGGDDPETLDRARENAPLTVLTLDRAVSVQDYEDFARGFAGIAKAHALWIPSGPGRGVFVTVAGIDGAAIGEGSDTYRNLVGALRRYGDPLLPLTVRSYARVPFRLKARIKVVADADPALVLGAVEAVLRQRFGFAARSFGQPVSIDEVVAVIHSDPGVVAVDVDRLYRGATPAIEPRLFAAVPVASRTAAPQPAELLMLAADPIELGVMP
jgi:predicted phage baseplate assembly protein